MQNLDLIHESAYDAPVNQAIEYEDLSEKVYRAVKALILAGELEPGEKLRQEDLSARLGVSRTPLASAFSKLEKEMLVELLPRRGARVRVLSKAELLELYEIRLRLEPLGAAEAASSEDKEGRSALRSLLEAYREAVRRGGDMAIRRADYAFHLGVVSLSGNEALYRIISSFNLVSISNQRGLLKPPEQSLAEHEDLARAIETGRSAEAERIMDLHLRGARDALLASRGLP
jgi:DNA-binding GntR family transcriptional regulator